MYAQATASVQGPLFLDLTELAPSSRAALYELKYETHAA